jgi:hypothetical protein
MRKKLRRRGRLARWFSTAPPEELVEIYVREEIARVLRADGVTLEDGECCPPWTKENFGLKAPEEKKAQTNGSKWPTIFAGKVVESQSEEVEALEAPKETPEKSKGLRRLLGVVVAEVAVVATLLLK